MGWLSTSYLNLPVKLFSSSLLVCPWESDLRRHSSSAWKMLSGVKAFGRWNSFLLSLSPRKPLRKTKSIFILTISLYSPTEFEFFRSKAGVSQAQRHGGLPVSQMIRRPHSLREQPPQQEQILGILHCPNFWQMLLSDRSGHLLLAERHQTPNIWAWGKTDI